MYDLLGYMKGLILQNHSRRISMTGATAEYPKGVSVNVCIDAVPEARDFEPDQQFIIIQWTFASRAGWTKWCAASPNAVKLNGEPTESWETQEWSVFHLLLCFLSFFFLFFSVAYCFTFFWALLWRGHCKSKGQIQRDREISGIGVHDVTCPKNQ